MGASRPPGPRLVPARRAWRDLLPALLAAVLSAVLLTVLLAACADPERSNPIGTVEDPGAPVPSGPHFYCISNVGHTLVAYDLLSRTVRPATARYLDLDPVGPWFSAGNGYYLSRVETSGAGSNALIRFDPKSKVETGRLTFAQNSNPNRLLVPPTHPDIAWVALRGATFDSFATVGVAVVRLSTLTQMAFCDLRAADASCPGMAGAAVRGDTSPLGFLWDAAGCGGTGCAYLVLNNFDGTVRDGRLLVLRPDADGKPLLLDSEALGRNPQAHLVRDADGDLWVVNNGGYVHFNDQGQAGTLQVLDTALLGNGTDDDATTDSVPIESPATCGTPPSPDPGCDPTGIFSVDGMTGWVTTYPHDVLRTVNLTANSIDALDLSRPRVTGPFFALADDPAAPGSPALFAALGGLGLARLGELNAGATALLADQPLGIGQAPLSCTAYDVP